MESGVDLARRFAEMVTGPTDELDLDRSCALLAGAFTGQDRTVEIDRALGALAAACDDATLPGVMAVLRPRLRGNESDYYDPRNSFLDEVLARGLGLPITLSVVAIEVGRRVGAEIVGVGLPGHFMVRDANADVFGDPFSDGAIYDRAGVIAAWERLVGAGQAFDDSYLAPATTRSILIRMLNNLRALYLRRGDPLAMHVLAILRGAFAELDEETAQHQRWVSPWN